MNETLSPPHGPISGPGKNRKERVLRTGAVCLAFWLSIEGVGYFLGWRSSAVKEAGNVQPRGNTWHLKAENLSLKRKIEGLMPRGLYIVIDTAENVLYLKEGRRVLLRATVSAGSGNLLVDPSGRRRWVFDTPRGEFIIQSKFEKPAWVKPDWAFIEEGKPIPKNPKERIEYGMLGDYALGFGNGYFIHGTLYTRLLGKNITHGCIRVGDQDLKILYQAVSPGTRVLIF